MIERRTREEAKYRPVLEVMELFSLSRGAVMKLSNKAGATLKDGRIVRIDIDKLVTYMHQSQ